MRWGKNGGRERREEESCSFSKYIIINFVVEILRLLENCWG